MFMIRCIKERWSEMLMKKIGIEWGREKKIFLKNIKQEKNETHKHTQTWQINKENKKDKKCYATLVKWES
jgi:hypothetical protein